MSGHSVTLYSAQQAHQSLAALWAWAKPRLIAGQRLHLSVKDQTRSLEQNAAQWPILDAFSKQLLWPVNGATTKMSPEEWKDVLTAAFERDQVRVAMGLDGGVVMLGRRTSKFGKAKFSEWLEFLNATAAARGIALRDSDAN